MSGDRRLPKIEGTREASHTVQKYDLVKERSKKTDDDNSSLPNSGKGSPGTSAILQETMYSLWKKAHELNNSGDQQQNLGKQDNYYKMPSNPTNDIGLHEAQTLKQGQNLLVGRFGRIMERFDLSVEDGEKLKQIAMHCEQSNAYNGPRDTQMIISDFRDIVSLNFDYSIKESLNMIKSKTIRKQAIGEQDVSEIHGSIHSTLLASRVYEHTINDSLRYQTVSEIREQKRKMFTVIKEFRHGINEFVEALDEAFPRTYSNSLGSSFELEQKSLWPARLSLDDQNLTKIQNKYEEVRKKQEGFIKSLDTIVDLIQKEKQKKLEKEKRPANRIRSRL
jgi:hypothetical protein